MGENRQLGQHKSKTFRWMDKNYFKNRVKVPCLNFLYVFMATSILNQSTNEKGMRAHYHRNRERKDSH